MSLGTRILAPAELDRSSRDQLFALFSSAFDHSSRERFERDLDGKHWVVLVVAGDGAHERLVGFTTAEVLTLEQHGRRLRFLYSGDTLVAPTHWQQPALPAAFGHLMLALVDREASPLYWFLISMGFRTYRLLTANFVRFIPDCRHPDDAELGELLALVADHKFGRRFDPASGIVRADPDSERLKPALQAVPPGRLANPHVAFFLARNPGCGRGDELACLAPCSAANLSAVAHRQLARVAPEWGAR